MKALFISKKGADAACDNASFKTTSYSISLLEPGTNLESQISPARDALLHLLVREDVKTQNTGAVIILPQIALRITAVTSPSSISRPPRSSAATFPVASVSSEGKTTELGSCAKDPELVHDNKARVANCM